VYLFLGQKAIGNLQKIRLLRDYYVIVFGVTNSWLVEKDTSNNTVIKCIASKQQEDPTHRPTDHQPAKTDVMMIDEEVSRSIHQSTKSTCGCLELPNLYGSVPAK
jgi:hypothetical protein